MFHFVYFRLSKNPIKKAFFVSLSLVFFPLLLFKGFPLFFGIGFTIKSGGFRSLFYLFKIFFF
ncbi:hypothetical protein HMPREF1551_02520 [Capnocytophaga sp. oral taxon 863 str. F0517]|nr:hypothetical protein HMPREF1551_02520 [Capnocytophaga sp. oral taxon 863 str. F0517]